ncbi:hypothetical protein L210DRAFT_959868 [Boletus edulis BED1]|uniref:Uncharacterized protein n=1 Tax=Boletus edulis BED1 TaxID=1328754 RepID=A0AAD4BVI7_BOLED|nr:hypothetical protein L210DRAFT_959868 [Boletus edulis BED1]
MSDLISTPSQTQSIVSNDAFEELIDLLASDGIDHSSSKLAGQDQADVSLRDPSGKLDFDKIRLMFSAQNGASSTKHRVLVTAPHEDSDSDDEARSHSSSTVHSSPQSTSPKPIERPSAGHRRSSTFGYLPWMAIHQNVANVRFSQEDAAPTLSRQPLSFDELNTALAGAHEEVRSLRRQYEELQGLVTKRWGTETRDQVQRGPSEKDAPPNGYDDRPADSQAQPGTIEPPTFAPSDVSTKITNLSEDEAKRTLTALACSLNLSLDTIGTLASTSKYLSPQQSSFPFNPSRQHDVASIARALKFLGTVDELVWRRTSAPSGPRTLLPVFSEENIISLVARLELWERAVRRPSRI